MTDSSNLNSLDQSRREPAIRVVLLPRDTNGNGTIFGGVILSYIDLAGSVEAGKHTKNRLVTVAMKEVVFHQPVLVGEVVSFYASTVRVGNTSVTVQVEVESKNRKGEIVQVTQAELTFVSVNQEGRPVPVR
jgi:acyl-CoA thioesterase YciA